MTKPATRPSVRSVLHVLGSLNVDFLAANRVVFEGESQAVMALGGYRDVDSVELACRGGESFRAVRREIEERPPFGALFRVAPTMYREESIRSMLRKIVGVVDVEGKPVRIMIYSYQDDPVFGTPNAGAIPVPALPQEASYALAIIRATDTYWEHYRDLLDLCAMFRQWGAPDEHVWAAVDRFYHSKTVYRSITEGMRKLIGVSPSDREALFLSLGVEPAEGQGLIQDQAMAWVRLIRERVTASLTGH